MQYSINIADTITIRKIEKDHVKERNNLLRNIRNALLNPYLDDTLKHIFEDRLAELSCAIFAH